MKRLAGRRPVPPAVFARLADGFGTLPYRWDPDYQARVGVLSREGNAKNIRWFDIEPCCVFHPLNAYDDGDIVHDATTDRTDLTLLDAGTLEPVATVRIPVRVPYGFHGNWVPTV